MILALLLIVPFVSGIICLFGPSSSAWGKGVSTLALFATLCIAVLIGKDAFTPASDMWSMELRLPWIPSWHIDFYLGVDSFSYWLILLTLILALLSVFVSRPQQRYNSYFACLLWSVSFAIGLFMSADVFLFFVFWELALLPVYWILVANGEKLGMHDTVRFIIYTQASGIVLLVTVLCFAIFNMQATGNFTFDYAVLSQNTLPLALQRLLLAGFLLAFLIKLPAMPFHGWMPALFSRGPAAIIMVAILVKTAVYGLVRFSWLLFPDACNKFSVAIMGLGIATMLYGAVLAFSQTDPKRILAYGTMSHAGLLLVGVFCQSSAGFYGVLMLLSASALSTAVMLMLFDKKAAREGVDLAEVSGLWHQNPRFSVVLLFMVLASMGFPLFGNFVGEWLILWASFIEDPLIAIVLSLGVVLSAAYSLRLFQRLCLGEAVSSTKSSDLGAAELSLYGLAIIAILGLGLSPSFAIEKIHLPFGKIAPKALQNEDSISLLQVVKP